MRVLFGDSSEWKHGGWGDGLHGDGDGLRGDGEGLHGDGDGLRRDGVGLRGDEEGLRGDGGILDDTTLSWWYPPVHGSVLRRRRPLFTGMTTT